MAKPPDRSLRLTPKWFEGPSQHIGRERLGLTCPAAEGALVGRLWWRRLQAVLGDLRRRLLVLVEHATHLLKQLQRRSSWSPRSEAAHARSHSAGTT